MSSLTLDPARSQIPRALRVIVLSSICLLVGLALCNPSFQIYALCAGPVIALLMLTRLSVGNLLVTFIWMTSLIHLLKKVIFLLGPQSLVTYYSVLLIPTALFLPVLFIILPKFSEQWKRSSTKFLLIFIGWSCVTTMFPMIEMPWSARLAALHERILPMTAFCVGLTIPLASRTAWRLMRALVFSALITVAYGVVLFTNGPTAIERAWAQATGSYSLQGRNTLAVIEGVVGPEAWRGFSYYADPLTWGLFLVAALSCALALRQLDSTFKRRRRIFMIVIALCTGLLVCATRTPWVGVLGMLVAHHLLRWRWARRPTVLFCVILAGFALVITLGTFMYERAMTAIPWSTIGNPLAQRYLTLGTLEARIGAWNSLKDAFSTNLLYGDGLAYNEYFARPLLGTTVGDPGAHNFMVETAVCCGIPGLLLFLAFIFALFSEGVARLQLSAHPGASAWILSFLVGLIATGYLSGSNFMNVYFFLLAGMLLCADPPAEEREAVP